MLAAFMVSLVAVVLAEMGDKTQLLAIAFAGRHPWKTVLWSVLWATLANHFLAVALGNFATSLLPMDWIKLAASLSFIGLGLWTLCADKLDDGEEKAGRSPFWTIAIAFFLAEMGDKTQIMTLAIAADEAVKIGGTGFIAKIEQTIPVLCGSTTGMLIADGIGIVVGAILHKRIPARGMRWAAAVCFVLFGYVGLHGALDCLVPCSAHSIHHLVLLASLPLVGFAMWLLDRMDSKRKN